MASAEKKVVTQRLSIIKLAEVLGNVSEAFRRRDGDRTTFYEYKPRFQTHGMEGLKDLPPIPHSHPQTTAPGIVPTSREVFTMPILPPPSLRISLPKVIRVTI